MIDEALGPYKILDQLGSGGMGDVYLAEDTRLNRKVAIKVLPPEFADHPKRLRRFEREAKAAAALNHPHIAAIFDIGAENDVHFMVQEYLEGDSLRQLMERRRLLLGESLNVGLEVAKALEAAHGAGIVHRDLKPDNVFVTHGGHAKVLDFGLAKLVDDSPQDKDSATMPDSIAGQIMGTPAYMAPEQANGEPADHRADMFAFGSMLYEMVAGTKSFDGRSTAEVLYRVVHDSPKRVAELSPNLPIELQRIIEKCQQKDPARRYQTAADLAVDIAALKTDIETGNAVSIAAAQGARLGETAATTSPWPSAKIWPAIAATALLTVIGTWALLPEAPAPDEPVVHVAANLPEGIQITRTERPIVAISMDGSRVVVSADRALYSKLLSEDEFRLIPGSEPSRTDSYAVSPAISPSGTDVAFFIDGSIRRMPIEGGGPIALAIADIPLSIHWATDGYVYYSQSDEEAPAGQLFPDEGIWRVSENGGIPEEVVIAEPGRRAASPQLLPGSQWLLYSTASATDFVSEEQTTEDVVIKNLNTGVVQTLIEGAFGGHYIDTGHILFQRDAGLWAVPFNLDGLEVSGGASLVIEQVPYSYWAGTAYYAVSNNGTLLLPSLSIITERNGDISWVDVDGGVEAINIPKADNPRATRDGTKIAAEQRTADGTYVWIHESDSGSWSKLTPETTGSAPVWSPDGTEVYFMTSDDQGPGVWKRRVALDRPAELLWRPEAHLPFPESIPDDGRFLIYSAGLADQNDVWLLWLDSDRGAIPLTQTPGISEEGAQIHPSGRWFAYTSRESGRYEIYVRELSEDGTVGRRFTISTSGGAEPMWSRDGSALYYRSGPQMLCVEVTTDPGFRAGETQVVLQEFPGDTPVLRADYDTTDSGRFLTSIPASPWSASRLDIVVNWAKEVGLR